MRSLRNYRDQCTSETVDEVSECLIIFCFGVVNTTMNRARIGRLNTSMCDHLAVCLIVSHLHQGGDVGVVGLSFVCHDDIIGTGGDDLRGKVDTAPTGTVVCVT